MQSAPASLRSYPEAEKKQRISQDTSNWLYLTYPNTNQVMILYFLISVAFILTRLKASYITYV